MSESITEELRLWASDRGFTSRHEIFRVADRIDARFDRELTAKQEEVDGLKADMSDLQAKLDASIPVPVDADGVPWTCADVDKSFSLTDGDKATEGTVREIAYAWPREGWWIVDQYDTHYPADRCRHVVPGPPETIEDVRKSCDSTVSYLASVSGMGWHDVETFSKDVHKQLDRAYSCGKRDGAGELDASMPLPVDADGVPCRIGDLLETEEHIPRKAVGYYLADESTPCVTLDFVSPSIEASLLHHVAPEPPDSQERIDADAKKTSCDYFGRPGLKSCDGCPAYNGDKRISCMTKQALDLLRRQRELDGEGERA